MKELDIFVFIAVFQQMLGPLFWILLLLAVVVVAAFAAVMVRVRGISPRRLVRAELSGIVGGIAVCCSCSSSPARASPTSAGRSTSS